MLEFPAALFDSQRSLRFNAKLFDRFPLSFSHLLTFFPAFFAIAIRVCCFFFGHMINMGIYSETLV